MTSQTLEQKIDFPISEVKTALNAILADYKTKFINQEINDIFNSYSFGTVGCLYNIVLNDCEGATNIKITCSSRNSEDKTSSASVTKYITEFTNILTAKLKGESKEQMDKVVAENNSSVSDGNMSAFFTIISLILTGIALYYIFSI